MEKRSSRRGWLRTNLGAVLLARFARSARGASLSVDGEGAAVEGIEARAREVGLGELTTVRTETYVGVGNAPTRFGTRALELCEGLSRDFLGHFTSKGFLVTKPVGRLVVVILADPDALGLFLGQTLDPAFRGVYDLDEDWLAICDNRGDGGAQAERANSVALFHEATHQLTYHTGLLDRAGDLPRAISEGFGTYGETRRPDGRTKIGARNAERLAVLTPGGGARLMPIDELIQDDKLFDLPETAQAAYSQSWLLVHMMMRSREEAAKFRGYLEAVKPRRDAGRRIADFEEHVGAVSDVDQALKRYASRLASR